MSRIIFAEPVQLLAAEFRAEAGRQRSQWGDQERAAFLEHAAQRIDAAVERGASEEWVPVPAAAQLLGLHPETVRIHCREKLGPAGKAKKVGGTWLVHVSAIAA